VDVAASSPIAADTVSIIGGTTLSSVTRAPNFLANAWTNGSACRH
jgi:hypothetical protein